ncbi:MAG TPA: dethiobiotin synthase [Turneriella sp.]|nr:dethiobiotin synthase [Turneriella sp.]
MPLFIAGTGTNIGKTMFSTALMKRWARAQHLQYLKPIQTGSDDDTQTVQKLSGLPDNFFLPNIYRFSLAASPHLASESERKSIDIVHLKASLYALKETRTVIELAGGLMVPLTREGYYTNCDLMRDVGFPAVLVASTALGTINHTVMSWKILKNYDIECRGFFFIHHAIKTRHGALLQRDNIRTIIEMTGAINLGLYSTEDLIGGDSYPPIPNLFL